MKTRTKGAMLILAMAGSLLTSCGGGNVEDKIRIGLECAYAPFNWSTKQQSDTTLPIANHPGTYADGYDIQIAKRIERETGKKVEIVQTQWESLITDLQMNSIDVIIAGMTDTAERRKQIAFTSEYYRSELVLIVTASSAPEGDEPLDATEFGAFINGKNVVSQVATVTNDVIDVFASDYGAKHVNPVATFALAAQDVVNGSAFAMTAELPVARSIVSQFDNLEIVHIDQAILGETQAELGVSIGVRKADTGLMNKLNEVLAKISTEERVSIMEGAVSRSAGVE